ncbi:MAG: DUF2303 family protein [Alphaproteobacteria bacterium]|nr:DUF2303 family protein [Alphaproteobacteria bacterium]
MPDTTPRPSRIPSEAQAVADIVRSHIKPEIARITGQPGQTVTEILVLPDGQGGLRAESVKPFLDPYRDKPERREGIATLTNLDSLIAHVNRFKDDDSALFCIDDPTNPALVAVLDYHRSGAESDPRFGKHRARYDFPLSDEWLAWKAVGGEPLEQGAFAEFLEDRIVDVMAPPAFLTGDAPAGQKAAQKAATPDDSDKRLIDLVAKIGGKVCGHGKLMELAKGLRIHDQQKVQEVINTASGEAKLRFESEHRDEAGKPIDVPNLFLIAIPVFRKGHFYRIPVRLRYRLQGGRITWLLSLHRPDLFFTDAVEGACDRAAEETELPLFYGQPES